MNIKNWIRKIRKTIMVNSSRRKVRKVFKKAKDANFMCDYDWHVRDDTITGLSDEFKLSLKNKYKGLFSKKGIGKYLDYTNPTDLRIQFLSDKYYGRDKANARDKVLKETLPDRRTHYEKKTEKEVDKLRKSLIRNKDEVKKIAFEKGHAWHFEAALEGIKSNGNLSAQHSIVFDEEMTKWNH